MLEFSYRMTRQGTTVWQANLLDAQLRYQQQMQILYYLGTQAGTSNVQAINADAGAIRMDGASVATQGYESVPGDYLPFRYSEAASPLNADSIVFSDKFLQPKYANQPAERGWTNTKIADTINAPVKVGSSINKYTGNTATLYYIDDIHYVAVDNGTGKIIQVADLHDPQWEFTNFGK